MTNQDAIKWVDGRILELACIVDIPPETDRKMIRINKEYNALQFVRGLLVRNTPTKPQKDSLADWDCPYCGAYLPYDALNDPIEDAPKFCKNCGQAIDWSEFDAERV